MIITKKQKKSFKELGYLKFKYPNVKKLLKLKKDIAALVELSLKKNLNEYYISIRNSKNKINTLLNEGMIKLEKQDHQNLVQIYNQIPRSISYYNVANDNKIISLVNKLLIKKENSNLFTNCNTIRMDTPGISKFMYGWHADKKSNIEDSNFVQLWLPVVGDVSNKMGGLHVLEKSFKYDIETTWTREQRLRRKKQLSSRAPFSIKLLSYKNKFKEKHLTCKFGEGILFNSGLMHKSGTNKTKNKMRYVLVCFYHDILNPKWKFQVMEHKK